MEIARTADCALRVMLLLHDEAPLSVSDVADRLDLSRAIAQRALTTLHLRGYVHRDDRGYFSLGAHLISLAERLPNEISLAAAPFLVSLAEAAKETSVLTERRGDIAQVAATHVGSLSPLRVEYQIGFRHPLNIGASGLVILAQLSPEEQNSVAVASGDKNLLGRLAQARQDGYASSEGQIRPGMSGIAAPVFGGDGAVLGSIALVAPTMRNDALKAHADHLMAAAAGITQQMSSTHSLAGLGRIHG